MPFRIPRSSITDKKRTAVRSWLTLVLLGTGSCSLIHEELPNASPDIQVSSADTTRVRRGGVVSLEVRASDEDDDPLVYAWNSLGAGSFSDSTSPATEWIAPAAILGNTELFLLTVTISDRQPDTDDVTQSFLIEVVQSPPTLTHLAADTLVNFREPAVVFDVFGDDADGDAITFTWEIVAGPEAELGRSLPEPDHTRAEFTPLFPGEYVVAVTVTDGSDTVSSEIVLTVPEPELPETGMVALDVPVEGAPSFPFEIDVYEYPNRKGETPFVTRSWFEAASLCADEGKRLCSRPEWSYACAGPEGLSFSSTDNGERLPDRFGRRFCNTLGSEIAGTAPESEDLAPSGHFPNCSSSTGVYDLTGNAFEWTMTLNALLERSGGFSLSSVVTDFGCGLFNELEPIAPEGEFDVTSQAQIDSLLQNPIYQGYLLDPSVPPYGFRCCRNR